MSPQIIELLIFAAIAFYIINKLISILGTTDDDSPSSKSRFGENVNIKDVTSSGEDWTDRIKIGSKPEVLNEVNKDILAFPEDDDLIDNIRELTNRIEKFTPETFIKNAGKAWRMILESLLKKDDEILKELVDRRYLEEFSSKEADYRYIDIKKSPNIKIADVTFFGHSIMIRLLIDANLIKNELGLGASNLVEEWTFSRNINQTGQNWFLSNISSAM